MDCMHNPGPERSLPPDLFREKRRFLRSNANFAGLFLLVLVASYQLAMPLVLLVLQLLHVVSEEEFRMLYFGMGNTAYLLIYGLVYILAMGTPLLLVLGQHGFNPFSPTKRVHPGIGILGFLGAVGGCMLANVITAYILTFLSEFGIQAGAPPQLLEHTPISLVLNLCVVALLPALIEELVFRGCVLRLLRSYGDWFAVVISAVLFGLMHGNLRQLPFATFVGLILGWLYVATNNIWLPMLVHFINNSISVVCEYASFSLSDAESAYLNNRLIFYWIAVGVVSAALLFGCYGWRLKVRKSQTGLSLKSRLLSFISAPAMSIVVVLFILLIVVEM